jgi:hypothetical protein
MIKKIYLVGNALGLTRLVLAGLVFSLLPACQPSPKWTPFEGQKGGGYPGQHWQKAQTPEQLGWSSEKLIEARAYSKKSAHPL